MTTRRENLIRLLQGQPPQWTPCSINVAQWFAHQRQFNKLPDELRDAQDHLDAMKTLGCDIFSRNVDAGFGGSAPGVEIEQRTEPGDEGPRHITRIHTPHGLLESIRQEQTALSTSYDVKDLVSDWPTDRQAYLHYAQRRQFHWDEQAYRDLDQRVGDDGVVLVPIGGTPLKKLHMDLGLDHSMLFIMDYPDDAKALCDLYWQQMTPVLKQLAGAETVHAVVLMDNLDTPFSPPSLARDYWLPYVAQAVDILNAGGKRLFVHACGQLAGLIDILNESKVDGLEGMAHPPLGDFTPKHALQMHDRFIYNGGFTAHEQTTRNDEQCRAFYNDFFQQLQGFDRFIFGAACQTVINTPWQRIKDVVSLCREHRGQP